MKELEFEEGTFLGRDHRPEVEKIRLEFAEIDDAANKALDADAPDADELAAKAEESFTAYWDAFWGDPEIEAS